jgi:hypothetical protein
LTIHSADAKQRINNKKTNEKERNTSLTNTLITTRKNSHHSHVDIPNSKKENGIINHQNIFKKKGDKIRLRWLTNNKSTRQ